MIDLLQAELQRAVAVYRAQANKIAGSEDAYKQWASLRDDYDFAQPVPAANIQTEGNGLTVFLDEPLDPWFFDVTGLTRDILQSPADAITLHINSIGGSVALAAPVYAALRTRAEAGARITTINTGMVASAAMMPFLAGDERYAGEGMAFVHNVTGFLFGGFQNDAEADKLTAQAKDLRQKISDQMVALYTDRMGKTEAEVKSDLDAEKVMKASDLVSDGYATHAGFPAAATPAPPPVTNAAVRMVAALGSMRGTRAVGLDKTA